MCDPFACLNGNLHMLLITSTWTIANIQHYGAKATAPSRMIPTNWTFKAAPAMPLGDRLNRSERRIRYALTELWAFFQHHILLSALGLVGSLLALFLAAVFVQELRATLMHEVLLLWLYGFAGPLLVLMIGFFAFWIIAGQKLKNAAPPLTYSRRVGVEIIAIFLVSFAAGGAWLASRPSSFWHTPPKTMLSLFKSDFNLLSRQQEFTLATNPETHVFVRVFYDFDAHVKFLGYYIPFTHQLFSLCNQIPETYKTIMEGGGIWTRGIHEGTGGTRRTKAKGLPFSGRIFVYHEGFLTNDEYLNLQNKFKANNLDLIMRGMDYLHGRGD